MPRKELPGILLALIAAAFLPSSARSEPAAVYQSATVCAGCHPEIYKSWRGSQHATTFVDPAFQLPYDRIRRQSRGMALPCEYCHNPMRFFLSPGDPRADIFAQEGITCDFCHSVETVDLRRPYPKYRGHPGVKFGPRAKSDRKGVHVTRFSRLHITSEFCGGCHDFVNGFGVAVLATYSEWKESFYRGEGVHCQFCHLPDLFDARFIAGKKRTGPSDHGMAGGRSRERLMRAIPVKASLVTGADEARLSVQIRNETVGHKTPTGLPLRRLRLATALYDDAGNVLGRKEELFERVLGDGTGKALDQVELVFTEAREVLKDNRIGPKETREVVHVFPLKGRSAGAAEVSLTYEAPTPDGDPALKVIEVPVFRAVIPARAGLSPVTMGVVLLGAAALAGGIVAFVLRRRG